MSRVSLFLMGEKGYRVLEHVTQNYKESVSHVVGARDAGVSDDYYNTIRELCRAQGIDHYDRIPTNTSSDEQGRYALAIGWRWMLPTDNPLIVIHDSLLPKYRGFAPLVNCLINGERVIGATALFGSDSYDTGDIIKQASTKIDYPIKISQAISLMSELYVEITDFLFARIATGEELQSFAQNHSEATYSAWRDQDDYWINWNRSSSEICRFIDAVGQPYLGATCLIDGERVFVRGSQVAEDCHVMDRHSAIGKVLFVKDEAPVVVCKEGMLKLTSIVNELGESLIPLKRFRARLTGRS